MNIGQIFIVASLFLFVIISDFADGYMARKIGIPTKFGAKFDVSVDFLLIFGIFLYYIVANVYPLWVLLLIITMFAQFMVTSTVLKIMFDPIGKYYGSLLYGAIGLTILFPEPFARELITFIFAGATLFFLVSRLIFLFRKSC